MENRQKKSKMRGVLAGFAVLLLAAMVTLAGCPNSNGGGGSGDPVLELEGTVSITGTAQVGATLTAVTAALGGTGTISYQWKADGADISGATGITYTLTAAETGKTITVTVTRAGYSGSKTSAATAAVIVPGPVLEGTVSITGTAQVGETLTAVTSLDGTGTISYQWKADGADINGAASTTYMLTAAEEGKTITVTVTRAGYSGSKTSAATAGVLNANGDPLLEGTISITGTAQVGQTLTAVTTALEGAGAISYQWKANGADISGATSGTYTLTTTEEGKTITLTVTRAGHSGSKTSTPTAAVPTFVAVTSITDVPTVAIMNRALSLSGTVVPSNATNTTIVWSGADVSGGVLTATTTGTYMVTATITNGASWSSNYTDTFPIEVYDAGSPGANPFGDDTTPFIWAMDDTGGWDYVIISNTTWESIDGDRPTDNGSYSLIGGIGAEWSVAGGLHTGDTGIAIIIGGKMIVANLTHEYSGMNGTFTKLNTGLTLDGTWISSTPPMYFGPDYIKIVAAAGDFTESLSYDGYTWSEVVKGTYPVTTNPAICTITLVNTGVFTAGADNWVAWSGLSQEYKDYVGGSERFAVLIYGTSTYDESESMGYTLQKQ
jgi:hypothetical protein